MSYLALYRRFRPQSFETLIGQEIVVQALKNQIKTDKVGHAYLFCGARGTGKTTAAKIFARAINCEEKSGEPCGKCSACLSLADANSLDIVEMDAASNNRVENVREIREKVQYPPVNGRYKVYIIDEVHMLTTEAFNALLKTLEEPPKHAVFILATTEPHKLPATILSRCMRFDFKLIPTQKIAKLIGEIYNEVGKEFEEEAVIEIARQGEGSVRDALSIADICLSFNNEKLTYNNVIDVLGASDRQKTAQLVERIFKGDSAGALEIVDLLAGLGKNVGVMIKDTLSYLRDVMVAKSCKNPQAILALPKDVLDEILKIASLIDNQGLLRNLEIFSAIENDVKYSTHPRIIFETAVVKATTKSADYNIDALLSRIAKLEKLVEENNGVRVVEKVVEKVVENPVVAKKPIEKIEPAPTSSREEIEKGKKEERAFGFGDELEADAPPADLFSAFDFFPKTQTQPKVEVEKAKPQENDRDKNSEKLPNEAVNPTSTVGERRIWGTVIRKLRETGNTMLWVICQELEAKAEKGVIYIYCQTEREYLSLTKKENFEKLKEIVSLICNYKIMVVKQEDKKGDDVESEIEKLKQNFSNLEIED